MSFVSYVVDKKEQKLLNMFFSGISSKVNFFGNILFKLGFDSKKILYLKRDDSTAVLSFYYSLEDGKFNENDKITLNNDLIYLEYENHRKIYEFRKKSFYKKDEDLERRLYRTKKIVDGLTYVCKIIGKGDFRICVKNDLGDEIKFSCKGYLRENSLNIVNENKLEEYLFNLKFSDSVEDVFKRVCQLVNVDVSDYEKIIIGFYKNKKMISGYSVERTDDNKVFIDIRENDVYKSYNRKISSYLCDKDCKVEIVFSNNGYLIELEFVNDGIVSEINNELELREYLFGLEIPVTIDELYKRICEIFLGDVNKYLYVKLSICEFCDETDMVHLENGKLKFFKMTKGGKVFTVDSEGKFSYMVKTENSRLALDVMGDVVTRYECVHRIGIVFLKN